MGWRGRGVKEKDNNGTNDVNTRAKEAATIGKNSVVYVNEVGQATMDTTVTRNGNTRVNFYAYYTPNNEKPAVVGDEGVKGPNLAKINKGPVCFAMMVTGEPSRKIANFRTLMGPTGNGVDVFVSKDSKDGMDPMLENRPWFICNISLILKKWTLNANLLKEDVSNVPVWVKLHNVPITAFSEDDLCAIETKLGTPLMLDSYTSAMCMES
nr:hypothetical protein [Tanacetum cinerariifolium]